MRALGELWQQSRVGLISCLPAKVPLWKNWDAMGFTGGAGAGKCHSPRCGISLRGAGMAEPAAEGRQLALVPHRENSLLEFPLPCQRSPSPGRRGPPSAGRIPRAPGIPPGCDSQSRLLGRAQRHFYKIRGCPPPPPSPPPPSPCPCYRLREDGPAALSSNDCP